MLPVLDLDRLWGRLRRGAGNNNFNYGLASIAAYLRAHDYPVEVLDPQFLPGADALRDHLMRGRYDVIGLSAYTPTLTDTVRTAELCRAALPGTKIVMGGPHCSYFPKTLENCPAVDYVVCREGEETLLELVRHLESGGAEPTGIPGLSFRRGPEVIVNPPRPYLDVNSLPRPAYELFPLGKYRLQPTAYKRLPTVTTLVSRGCPYPCTFCHAHEVLGRKVRYRAVEAVMDELRFLCEQHGARGFMFQDSTFTFSRDWVNSFCEAILRSGMDFSWMCFTRVDRVDPDLLRLMRRAGCYGISFGIESANQKSLELLRKGVTVEQNRAAIRMALEAGLYVTATYMIALPGEDESDTMRTFHFAMGNPTHIAHFFWPIPYPKTHFFDQCMADGGIAADYTWESFNIYAERPVYVNPRIGLERMKALQRTMIRRYYTNPRVLAMNLRSVSSWTDVRKYLQAAMALAGYLVPHRGNRC